MTTASPQPETLAEFKDSFFYGSRADLNFKFLQHLPEQAAAEFFRLLLWKLGGALDDGDFSRLIEHVLEWQGRGYAEAKQFAYADGPFTPPAKPLSQARMSLIASSGHFVDGDDPEPLGIADMTQEMAMAKIMEMIKLPPTLSAIPFDTPPQRLRVRHGGYDIRGAEADHNVALPLDGLRQLQTAGKIGALTENAYSFMGACAQMRLLKQNGPQWVSLLQAQAVEALLLVPV
jgi:hypothetical protein